MATDIRRLAELTESSLEEARAQRPQPVIQWLLPRDREAADSIEVIRQQLLRPLETDSIVQTARDLALSTLPAEPKTDSELRVGSIGGAFAASRAAESLFLSPITAADRTAFKESVDRYEARLREWLASFEDWRNERALIFEGSLLFENRGRVPALGVRAQLHFPDEFQPVEEMPELEDPPRPPRFKRRSFADALTAGVLPNYEIPMPRISAPGFRSNISPPRYRKGSTIVDYRIDKLLHGIPEESAEPFMLRIPHDGEYTIPWEIHAENLEQPGSGELRLTIVTREHQGTPITSLEDLLAGEEDEGQAD